MTVHIFDRILSLEEASQRSGISASWLRRLIDDGRLPARKVGKTWLVLGEDVDAIAAQSRPRGRPMIKSALQLVGGAQAEAVHRSVERTVREHQPRRKL
jgi:excisionase family DNA binding protein